MEIRRGQLLTSLRALSQKTGISMQSTRTSLAHLEETGEITRESTRKGTLITVCKYVDYQAKETPANTLSITRPTHDQHTANTPPTQTLEYKEYKDLKDCYCSNAPAPARVSEGFSFWALPQEKQQQEQQDFFEIFFFGNYRGCANEVKRFIATNERHQWQNKGRTECYSTPEQRRAIAQLWKPASHNPRIPSATFLDMWRKLYALAKADSPDVAALMLDERVTVGEISDGRVFVVCHQKVWDWITAPERAKLTRGIIDTFTTKQIHSKIIY